MGVAVTWADDEKTIVHYRFDTNWNWDEFFAAKAQAQDLINSVPRKVAVILETQHDGAIPLNLLTNARNGMRTKNPKTAMVVIVATRPFIRTMVSTIRAMSPLSNNRIELASTLDEALAIARQAIRALPEEDVTEF